MENKLILTAEETAKLLGIGMNKIYELLISGELPAKRIGRKYLISKLMLENWLNCSTQKG
jgi:excisionase family DNA binding protein